jgi:hypothetical protein
MKIKISFFLFLFSLNFSAFSQGMLIQGHVSDTTESNEKALPNAVAMLVRIKDSVLVDFKRSDFQGNFSFKNIPVDTFQLLITHHRFSDQSYYIFGNESNKEINIKRIILPPKSQQLKEVVIYAYKDPVYYKGDTLIYVADSFATAPNAVVEDLLKKLPGIKVEADGNISSQGKEIGQVLVDGDEFFGSDATIATKNLAAKGVESVAVYEKKSENAADGEETIQVLDLRLKDDAKKGYFGKVSAGTDFQRFYEGELLANRFNKKQKISVFNLLSNTTRSSLEWRDAYKYGVGTGWQYNEDEDIWTGGNENLNGKGIPRTWKSGVYYSDQFNKKTELSVNYTYGNNSLLTEDNTRSQFFLSDTSYTTNQTSRTFQQQISHVANINLKHKIDSLTSIEVSGKFSQIENSQTKNDTLAFISSNSVLERNNSIENTNLNKTTSIDSRILITREFKKKNRKATLSYTFGLDDIQSNGNLNSRNVFSNLVFINDTLNQSKENESNAMNHRVTAIYVEPISKKVKTEFEYEFYNGVSFQEKLTFNQESTPVLDSLFSNAFSTNRTQHRGGFRVIYEHKKQFFSVGVRARNVVLDNFNKFTDSSMQISDFAILPRLRYTYKFTPNNRINIVYNTSSSLPTINQIQPVPDNTNPNRLNIGNPDLKPNYVHRGSISYNIYKPISGRYFYSNVNYNYVQNAFSNAVIFDEFGRTLSQTINVDGNYNGGMSLGGGIPFLDRKLELNPYLQSGINRYKNKVNDEMNVTTNRSVGSGLDLTWETDSLQVVIGGNFNYNNPTSSINTSTNLPYYSQEYEARLKLKLPGRFVIETDATYTINSRLSDGYNINFLLWNASIQRNFLKNENLILSAVIYDILNQNISAGRSVSANIITDNRTNIIARYFLVKATLKFNNNKTKENDDAW